MPKDKPVHQHPDAASMMLAALDRMEARQRIQIALLASILKLEVKEMADLTQITDKVTAIEGAADSAIELINALAAEVRANATDPAALSALADRLEAESSKIGAAVAANPA